LLVEPVQHRGKAALTAVTLTARGALGCVFQRQRYDLCFPDACDAASAAALAAAVGEGRANGCLVLVTCPVNRPVGHYLAHPGLTPATTAQRLEAYGRNVVRGFFAARHAGCTRPVVPRCIYPEPCRPPPQFYRICR
jgi:hypothetical protein